MSDQNKNTGTPASGTPNKAGNTSTGAGQHTKDPREQGAAITPNHDQGREHVPNVDAKKDAADTRRTADQGHAPTTAADKTAKTSNSTDGRKDNEASDAKRTPAQGNSKPGHGPVMPTGGTRTDNNS